MSELLKLLIEYPVLLIISVAMIGLCVGSFLNVVIYRTPKMMYQEWQAECQMLLHPEQPMIEHDKLNLSVPASRCGHCGHVLRWYHNIPVISWLCLRGKCGFCGEAIAIRYPLVELLTAFCSVMVVIKFGATWQMLWGLVLTWTLIALTFIDFDTQLLPDRYTLPLAGLGLAINSYALYTSATQAIWGYIIGFLCLWIIYYLFKLFTGKEGMGYGDFKLLAALGAWLGPMLLPLIILLSSLVGAIVGIVLLKIRKENQPFAFGPYIAIAGWIAFLWGDAIMRVYLGH